MNMEDVLKINDTYNDSRVRVLVIYDIVNDKKRGKLVKYLLGYGFRVQKSAFEAKLSKQLYHQLIRGLKAYASSEDNIRVYRFGKENRVVNYGMEVECEMEQVIIT